VISLKDIRKTYGHGIAAVDALKGVSLEIKDGEFIAIMGASGSGKSTMMHILGCLDTPTAGTYLLDKHDVSKMTDDELATIRKDKIGFVFQAFNLLPRTTVVRNVMLPMVYEGIPEGERRTRAHEALHAAGLDDTFFTHLSNQLSGGQTQRVAIARALVNNPALILADEPTGNLDSATSELILGTFEALNEKQGRTVAIITHESDIAAFAKRIIVMKDGKIIDDRSNSNRRHYRAP
jgi:putative ABC transport system ATP-binding protein